MKRPPPRIICSAFILLAVFLAGDLRAGPSAAADDSDDYVMQVWNTDSGLPYSSVASIAQTPDGYLWVGTFHGGLARFDGVRFVNFYPGNTPQLKSIEIHKLLVDAQGTLWIGNVEGGLISYRDDKFRFEYWNMETPGSRLENILSDRPGKLEFSTGSGMIFRRISDLATNRWETFSPPDNLRIVTLCQDADGVTWYRTLDGKLGQIQGTKIVSLSHPPGLRNPTINALVKDARGRIWVGTQKEIAIWNGSAFADMTPTNGERNVEVRQLLSCADGSFWVLTPDRLRKSLGRNWRVDAGLWGTNSPDIAQRGKFLNGLTSLFVDSHGGIWFAHNQNGIGHVAADGRVSWVPGSQPALTGAVHCWFEDHEGNIWVGLSNGGLARLRPRIFHPVWPAAGVDAELAASVCEDENGVIWFGTGEKQVWSWDHGTFSEFDQPAAQSFVEIKVLPAGGGKLWVGSVRNGVLELAGGKFNRPFPESAIGNVVRCLCCDRRGALWIGSEFGLFRWDKAGLKAFSIQDGFSPAYVLSIAEDKNGDMWFGTALGELRRFHAGKFETFLPGDSLTDESTFKAEATADGFKSRGRGALSGGERFWSLYFDDDNVLWIGSLGGGLLRFKDGQFARITAHDDLPSDYISQILEDHQGWLWLGTGAGIARVGKSELKAFMDGGKVVPTFVTYGKSDGLPALDCSGGTEPNCWRGRDGRLWFTTVKGAGWINPAELPLNRLPPPVQIEEFWLDGRIQVEKGIPTPQPLAPQPERIRIAAGQHYFEFKFSALSLTSPDKVKFKWRLASLEKDWVDGRDHHAASYSLIPPGDYRFEVLACNNDGVWSGTPAVMELTVLPYFWQRWWFKVAVGLGLAAGLMAVYSIRISRLRLLERLRLRIARDLHDEVGANLGSISLLAQLMEKSPSSADAAQVRGIAVQTIDTLRDIIWFIDPTHDNLSDLVMRLQETARVMLAAVPHTFEPSGDFHSAGLSLAFRRNVPSLFKEVLHNLLKHSSATEVIISVARADKIFQFQVRDNGVGFCPETNSSGNGLKNMKRRTKEIGGELVIQSAPGGGTVITLRAPIT